MYNPETQVAAWKNFEQATNKVVRYSGKKFTDLKIQIFREEPLFDTNDSKKKIFNGQFKPVSLGVYPIKDLVCVITEQDLFNIPIEKVAIKTKDGKLIIPAAFRMQFQLNAGSAQYFYPAVSSIRSYFTSVGEGYLVPNSGTSGSRNFNSPKRSFIN